MAVHTKHPFRIKILNFIHSKNSLFHIFIFLIGLSIGFFCAFYLINFSLVIQTSIFSVLHALSSVPVSSLQTSPPSDSSPPLPLTKSSLALPKLPIISPVLILSPLPQPPLPLPSRDSPFLSPSPSPQSQPKPSPAPTLAPTPTPVSESIHSTTQPSPAPAPAPAPLLSESIHSTTPPSPAPATPPAPAPAPAPLLSESIHSAPHQSLMPASVSLNQQIPMMHNMSDDDLVKSAMEISTMSVVPYKVAFMFLTSGPMPLSPLWELFFKGHESLFSIYIHPHPSYNDTFLQDSIFYGRRITSQPVYWGDISMVDAERRLLANALLDPSNQRFVLLSESCIPLFNFTTIYNYLVNSNLSYINSFDDPRKSGRGRYNPQMSPNITIQEWRKGSQWFEVHRDLALGIIADQKYYNLFKEYCHPPCYNDEHYLSTMVYIMYPKMNSNRSITYVDWSIAGPHPRKFVRNDITEEFLSSIRFGSTECVYNNNMTPMCVLFARKFTPGTLMPLLKFASMLFGSNP